MPGYVYIIELENHKHIKIGSTISPVKRLRTISSQSGHRINRQYVSALHNNYKGVELRLHGMYRFFRRHGEYFNIDFERAVKSLNKCII